MGFDLGLLTQDASLGRGTDMFVKALPGKFGYNKFACGVDGRMQNLWIALNTSRHKLSGMIGWGFPGGHITEESDLVKPKYNVLKLETCDHYPISLHTIISLLAVCHLVIIQAITDATDCSPRQYICHLILLTGYMSNVRYELRDKS